jgi:LysM repeat protein
MILHVAIVIFVAILVLFTSVAFASPSDSFENELKEYIDSESGQYYDGEDSQLKELFTPGDTSENEDKSVGTYSRNNTSYHLPSHINVPKIISTTVVKPTTQVVGGYKVKQKDTLSLIAKKYKMKVETLKKMNGLRGDLIKIGQVLRINGSKPVTNQLAGSTIIRMKVFATPVISGRVTSRFGYRRDPFNPSLRNFHSGLDLSAPVGTPIIASAEGVVEFKGRNGGYGNTVIIRHKGGYKTIYAHCSTTVVEVGDFVKMGKVIGSVGRTGTATGAHLHFEVVYKGKLIDPERALRKVEIVTAKPGTNVTSIVDKS